MSDESVFKRMDEEERIYAPEELASDDPLRREEDYEDGDIIVSGSPVPGLTGGSGSIPGAVLPPPQTVHRAHDHGEDDTTGLAPEAEDTTR